MWRFKGFLGKLGGVLLTASVLLKSAPSLGDWGVRVLRLDCNAAADLIQIEPYIAWNEEASTPSENEQWSSGDSTFYSFGAGFNGRGVRHVCRTRSRSVEVTLRRDELTVKENGRPILEGLPVGNVWDFFGPVYALRSVSRGYWEQCFDRVDDDYASCRSHDIKRRHVASLVRTVAVKRAKDLLDKGAFVDTLDMDGNSALHTAASENSVELAKLLLDHGASIEMANAAGMTPLTVACHAASERLEVVRFLLGRGANPNGNGPKASTPLLGAAIRLHVSTAELLLESGADPNMPGALGDTAMVVLGRFHPRPGSEQEANVARMTSLISEKGGRK